jgi:hypothetical protein
MIKKMILLTLLLIVVIGCQSSTPTLPPKQQTQIEPVETTPVPNVTAPRDIEVKNEWDLSTEQVDAVKASLDQGFSIALSENKFTIPRGKSVMLAIGFDNKLNLLKYFYTHIIQGIYTDPDGREPKLKLDMAEWSEPDNYTFQVKENDRKIVPFKIKVPLDAEAGEYTFYPAICYFSPTTVGGGPETGCNIDQNKRYGNSNQAKITVTVNE